MLSLLKATAVALQVSSMTPTTPIWQDMLQPAIIQTEPAEPYEGYCDVNPEDEKICK